MVIRILGVFAILSLVLSWTPTAEALFRKPELEKIPVDKLVKNLEQLAKKESKSINTVNVRYNLARVHAMAYALKVESVEYRKGNMSEGAWLGFTPGVVPFKPVEAADKAKEAHAKMHLDKAIAAYKDLITDQPMHLPAQLGLAWCLEQAGDTDEAIKGYREVASKGWEKEHKLKTGPLGGNFLTKEAAGYLIPLLDKKKDINEIEDLQARVAILNKLPRPVTPIAIPLKDGLTARDLEDRNASVAFDADGTGLDRRWTWITKDAAWLVYVGDSLRESKFASVPKAPISSHEDAAPQRTRGASAPPTKITSALQLFGNVTFWCFWDNGYEAMRTLDDNADGMLTGQELKNLALWHDANGNGVCDAGEVQPLSYHGITGLSCDWQADERHPDRIAFSPRGVTFANGTTRPTFDLILQQRK